jgi:uncharacterized protein (TIGR02452 family)
MGNQSSKFRPATDETIKILNDKIYNGINISKINDKMLKNIKIYENDLILSYENRPRVEKTKIDVRKEVTIAGCEFLNTFKKAYDKNLKIGVLDFASFIRPGGHFTDPENGSTQEEHLCRCSLLYNALCDIKCKGVFEINNKFNSEGKRYFTDHIISVGNVLIIRDANEKLLKSGDLYEVTVYVSAAADGRWEGFNEIEGYKIMETRIDKIFKSAIVDGMDMLVLGAIGCGINGLDANKIGEIFKKKINEYDGYFERIIFSILGENEFNIFKRVFE